MMGATSLLDTLQGHPDAVAIFCAGGGPRLTRSQLRKQVIDVAIKLRKSGIRPGDAVSIADTNTVLQIPDLCCSHIALDMLQI